MQEPSAECRIKCATATHDGNGLPLRALDSHHSWCEIVTRTTEINAGMQPLALASSDARRWEPQRLQLFITTATLTRYGWHSVPTVSQKRLWGTDVYNAATVLRALHAPD